MPKDPTKKKEEGIKERLKDIPKPSVSVVYLVMGLIFFFILFIVSPLPQALGFVIAFIAKQLSLTIPQSLQNNIITYLAVVFVSVPIVITLLLHPEISTGELSLIAKRVGTSLIALDFIFLLFVAFWFIFSANIQASGYWQTLKCAFSFSSNCQTSTQTTNLGFCKPITDTKYVDVKFGEQPNYKIINPVRADHVFTIQLTVLPYGDHTTNGITISGEVKNETQDTIKMLPDRCLTSKENCQVGPSLPPLVITLTSAKKINFLENTLSYVFAYVSYPVSSSGSNDFYIVRSPGDIQSLIKTPNKPLDLGNGPLDTYVHFSTTYYPVGSSKINPDSANIEVLSDILNGKKRCFSEDGYGKIDTIKISHTSDIQGITASCKTPVGDAFNEGETHSVGGLSGDVQEYTCTFTAPDSDLGASAFKSVKFTTQITYNYTEIAKTTGLTVCPSDASQQCLNIQ